MANNYVWENVLKRLHLPVQYFDNHFSIYEKYQNERSQFKKIIDQFDNYTDDSDKNAQVVAAICRIKEISNHVFDVVGDIILSYEDADMIRAYSLFDSVMESIERDLLISTIDGIHIPADGKAPYKIRAIHAGNYRFFRVRPVQNRSAKIEEDAYELFHLPISKISRSSNERFSRCGFPALYLSSELPLAWQECAYPNQYYYSEFQYIENDPSDLTLEHKNRFISLYTPREILNWSTSVKYGDFGLWTTVVEKYLCTYPLTLACSFVNETGNAPYKQEYIIPQMLMQWVRRNHDRYFGISYFTCLDTSLIPGYWNAYNIAIPATNPYDENGYSKELDSSFYWSKPYSYSIPISTRENNLVYRKYMNDLIENIDTVIHTDISALPEADELFTAILDLQKVVSHFQNLLTYSNNADMKFVLGVLSSISYNILSWKDKHGHLFNSSSNADFQRMYDIYNYAFPQDSSSESLENVLHKCMGMMWNGFSSAEQLFLVYRDESELGNIISWLNSNHILWKRVILRSASDIRSILREFSEAELQDVFNTTVTKENIASAWLENNLNLIKTPFMVRYQSVSCLFRPNEKMYNLICCGIDKRKAKNAFEVNAHG